MPSRFRRFVSVLCVFTLLAATTLRAAENADSDPVLPKDLIANLTQAQKQQLVAVARLVSAGSYVAGMGFGIAAIAKFKAHKDNPTEHPISMPIVFLFVAAALIFAPMVFRSIGGTIFDIPDSIPGVDGIDSFTYAVMAGVVTTKTLEYDVNQENKAGLKDSLEFLMTVGKPVLTKGAAADRALDVMLGALFAVHQTAGLSLSQKEELSETIAHAAASSLDEAGIRSENLAAEAESLVGEALGELRILGYSKAEELTMCGKIVKGVSEGLGAAGLSSRARVELAGKLTKRAVLALRGTEISPVEVDQAVGSIARGAFEGVFSSDLSATQYHQAASGIVKGAQAGLREFLGDKRWNVVLGASAGELGAKSWLQGNAAIVDALLSARKTLEAKGEMVVAESLEKLAHRERDGLKAL